ncbi:hypothetical protein [Oscillatoria acuminata]|uniref:Uncharacterized protein n=1 Tax=Oscillatoria acuminata PCC 6304 TaxID=56110 RepID=K9TCY7_9CYAN|nr:hypothetical protein [Oscillatoria acuminata]AFY79859.1 hypothetical protein Oscil6304_0101 [Oscillatoria acuminata PCC 6304]
MTFHPQEQWIIPKQTVAVVAWTLFLKGDVYMLMSVECCLGGSTS